MIALKIAIMQRMIEGQVTIRHRRKPKENCINNLLTIEANSNGLTGTHITEDIRAVGVEPCRVVSVIIRRWGNPKAEPFHDIRL